MTSSSDNLPPELAQIEAEAAAMTAAASPIPGQETAAPAEQPVDYLTDAQGIVDMGAAALGAWYPRTEPVLNDAARGKLAAAVAPVMEKYGLTLGALFGRWGAEINLAFALVSLGVPIAKAISADRAEQKAAQLAATGQAPAPLPIEKAGLQPVIDRTDPNSLHTRA